MAITKQLGVGTHQITFKARTVTTIDLFGGGGGGGSSVYTGGNTDVPGSNGSDTTLTLGGLVVRAGGGKGGGSGWWGNGSHFGYSSPAEGGTATNNNGAILPNGLVVTPLRLVNGNTSVVNRWSPQPITAGVNSGGATIATNFGGQGAWGIGDENLAGGTSGGSGAFVRVQVTNITNADITVSNCISVGAKGLASQINAGNRGNDGGDGYCVITAAYIAVIKSGTIEPGEAWQINRQSWEDLDYTDNRVAIFINPESAHEGWELSRTKDTIGINVWHRSGTSRIGYSGRISYVLLRVADGNDAANLFSLVGSPDGSGFVAGGVANAGGTDTFEVAKVINPYLNDFIPNLLNGEYQLFICPEAGHEGWEIKRTNDKEFSVSIWNRSGTSRIGYSGKVSWALFKKEALPKHPYIVLMDTNNGDDFNITKPVAMEADFTSRNFALLISPEGGHEAWTDTRNVGSIYVDAWNRSGTSRTGYSGYLDWGLFIAINELIEAPVDTGTTLIKSLVATVRKASNSALVGITGQDFSYKGNVANEIVVTPANNSLHVNLWDYFQVATGRQPTAGENITFIIPESTTLIGTYSYQSAFAELVDDGDGDINWGTYLYRDRTLIAGSAALSLEGWNAALGNTISIDVRGKLIGAFSPAWRHSSTLGNLGLYPYLPSGVPLTLAAIRASGLFPNDEVAKAAYIFAMDAGRSNFVRMLNPRKQPAIYTAVDCKVIIRNGAYVLGGGGRQFTHIMHSESDVIDGSEYKFMAEKWDTTNSVPGEAIWVDGTAYLEVENYGYLSCGGGGGAGYGLAATRTVDNCAAEADGGSGAPYAGIHVENSYPYTLTLATLAAMSVRDKSSAELSTGSGRIKDENGNAVDSSKIIDVTYANVRNLMIAYKSTIGLNSTRDHLPNLITLNQNPDRFLSPTTGTSSGSAVSNYLGGSGGAPGVDGQLATIIANCSTHETPNYGGPTPDTVFKRSANATFTVTNLAGSTYNP